MDNETLDFSKKIFLTESLKENHTSNQEFPFKIQYGNAIKYSIYEKAIFAAKEAILRKLDEQSFYAYEEDKLYIARNQYLKNILFGPIEVFTDALNNLAKAYVKASCLLVSVLNKNPIDFEKELPDLSQIIEITRINLIGGEKFNQIEMCVSFRYDTKEKLTPTVYDDNYSECKPKFADYCAVELGSVLVKLAVLDVYNEPFKLDDDSIRLAKRGDVSYNLELYSRIDNRFEEKCEKHVDVIKRDIDKGINVFENRLVHVYYRNENLGNNEFCLACNKFSQKESTCGGANLQNDYFNTSLSKEDEEILKDKFFKIKFQNLVKLYVPEEILEYFVSTKYDWLEWVYLLTASKLAKEDIAEAYCKK